MVVIEAFFGSLITLIFLIIMLAFWYAVAAVPWFLGKRLFRLRNIRVPFIIAVLLLTGAYYAYFPWHIFNNFGNNYQSDNMAATGWVKTQDFDERGLGFLYYQAKIIVHTDHLFASYRYVKALKPEKDNIIAAMVQAIGLVVDFPAFVILYVVYNVLACLIAVVLMIWSPTLTILVACIIKR